MLKIDCPSLTETVDTFVTPLEIDGRFQAMIRPCGPGSIFRLRRSVAEMVNESGSIETKTKTILSARPVFAYIYRHARR